MKIFPLAIALAALSVPSCGLAADNAETLLKKAQCTACHSVDKKLLGPGFKSVADRYRDFADAQALLEEKVRKGGAGRWGTMPMPALRDKDLSDAEVKIVVRWILSLK
ncbi:MAG: hypothetical protein A2Z95_02260 [Gallionellales bacterium GWA2_60_18]|nr:MAG: hypothetical protein A2Z95_02260 [Gallionellales bacterium GWA2_60_18]